MKLFLALLLLGTCANAATFLHEVKACGKDTIGRTYSSQVSPRKYFECTEKGIKVSKCPPGTWFYENSCVKDEDTCDTPTTPLYRYMNNDVWDHFYTTSWDELGDGADGWRYEGVQGQVYSSQVEGTEPLHRYWNGEKGDHFYTLSLDELGEGKDGYEYEGVACYVFPTSEQGGNPLYRYWRGGDTDHFYTTSLEELADWDQDYVYEGVAGFIL